MIENRIQFHRDSLKRAYERIIEESEDALKDLYYGFAVSHISSIEVSETSDCITSHTRCVITLCEMQEEIRQEEEDSKNDQKSKNTIATPIH